MAVPVHVPQKHVAMTSGKATKSVIQEVEMAQRILYVGLIALSLNVGTACLILEKSVMMAMWLMVMDVILHVRTNPNASDQSANVLDQSVSTQSVTNPSVLLS
jgi:uncharacterized membrane protein|tara:strand:- start:2013 stop:2321 length:309 start_codon:yes stop_codon:yes gene_type:complete